MLIEASWTWMMRRRSPVATGVNAPRLSALPTPIAVEPALAVALVPG